MVPFPWASFLTLIDMLALALSITHMHLALELGFYLRLGGHFDTWHSHSFGEFLCFFLRTDFCNGVSSS
jgi:hypothetical protein